MELRAATTATRLDQLDACSLAHVCVMFERIAPQLCANGHCVCTYFLFENTKTVVKSKTPNSTHDSHTHRNGHMSKNFSPQPTGRTPCLSAASQWPSVGPLMVWAKLKAETDESLFGDTQAKSQCSRSTDSRSVFHFFHVA
jgi:hypothetical protein